MSGFGSAFSCFGKIVSGRRWTSVCDFLIGMILALVIKKRDSLECGIKYTSKKILQYAVVLLGFGLNLEVVMETGKQSLPIIVCTITTSLVISYILHRTMNIPEKISTLVGVGSSICGGSAIAATAPVIDADEEEVAQAISVIFLFNILAALIFPVLGTALGFSTTSGEAFGIFAGTAVNDTSSVTAAASTWDSMYHLGSQTLDKAVTVKLTRTLAIIPITLILALRRARKAETERRKSVSEESVSIFYPVFYRSKSDYDSSNSSRSTDRSFSAIKRAPSFSSLWQWGAIGFHTDVVKLDQRWRKPILMGMACWLGITVVTLSMQHLLNLCNRQNDKLKTQKYKILL